MRVKIKGKNTFEDLTQNDFISAGGEGEVYAKGATAFKIYTDPTHMIPIGKIQELSVLDPTHIIRPIDILLNDKNRPVGYTMKYLSDTYPLIRMFTKKFRDNNHIKPDQMLKLVQQMQKTTADIHPHGILVVDYNEMNFLSDKTFKNIYFIDVDSYETPNYPATALMDSIRDRHTKKFNTNSDWFSFGIVSFQMFVGIHPYRGTHKTIRYPANQREKELDERMMKNIPLFHPDVTYNQAGCQPLSVIPKEYMDWYTAIFRDGKRLPPPSGPTANVQIIKPLDRKIVSAAFEITELYKFDEEVISFLCGPRDVVAITKTYIYFNRQKFPNPAAEIHLSVSPKKNEVFYAYIENKKLVLFNLTKGLPENVDISADDIMSYNGSIFVKNGLSLEKLMFTETPEKTFFSMKRYHQVLPKAKVLFDGVVIQNMLGAYFCSIFPESLLSYQVQTKELDGYQIIEAKYEKQVLMVVGNKKSHYDRFIFKFDKDFKSYSVNIVTNIHYSGLNFVVLENGVCANINEDGDMELFKNDPAQNKINVIRDQLVEEDMMLGKDGTKVLFARDNKIYSIKMK